MTVLTPSRSEELLDAVRSQDLTVPPLTHPGWAALLADLDAVA